MAYSIAVIVFLIFSLLAQLLVQASSMTGTDAAKYISVLVSPLAICATLAVMLAFFKQPAKRLMPLKCHPKYYLIGVLIIFGMLFSLSWVNGSVIKLFELMGYTRRNSPLPDMTGWKVIPVLICVAVIPAITEEILFRGMLLNNLEDGAGSVRTVFIVGFCFSLYHCSVEQTVYQFICGCLFALLTVRARAVTPAVVIHFINNALIIILTWCGLIDPATDELVLSVGGKIALYIISALSLIGGVVWLILDKTELKKCEKGGVKYFFIFASIGIAALAALWIAGMFPSGAA